MEEPDVTNADVDYNFFDEKVWPVMANRAKCFENLKVIILFFETLNPCNLMWESVKMQHYKILPE